MLLNEMGKLVTQDTKKAEVLNAASQEFQVTETRVKDWSKGGVPLLKEDHLRGYLSKLDV